MHSIAMSSATTVRRVCVAEEEWPRHPLGQSWFGNLTKSDAIGAMRTEPTFATKTTGRSRSPITDGAANRATCEQPARESSSEPADRLGGWFAFDRFSSVRRA